jgi:hypothetical protein
MNPWFQEKCEEFLDSSLRRGYSQWTYLVLGQGVLQDREISCPCWELKHIFSVVTRLRYTVCHTPKYFSYFFFTLGLPGMCLLQYRDWFCFGKKKPLFVFDKCE